MKRRKSEMSNGVRGKGGGRGSEGEGEGETDKLDVTALQCNVSAKRCFCPVIIVTTLYECTTFERPEIDLSV